LRPQFGQLPVAITVAFARAREHEQQWHTRAGNRLYV
jgi:polysaccharide deacetylase 2 family uncharacterized protein YibQ